MCQTPDWTKRDHVEPFKLLNQNGRVEFDSVRGCILRVVTLYHLIQKLLFPFEDQGNQVAFWVPLCGASKWPYDMMEFSLVYLRFLSPSGSNVYRDYRVNINFWELLTCLNPFTVIYPYKHKIGLVELILLADTDLWLRWSVVTLMWR